MGRGGPAAAGRGGPLLSRDRGSGGPTLSNGAGASGGSRPSAGLGGAAAAQGHQQQARDGVSAGRDGEQARFQSRDSSNSDRGAPQSKPNRSGASSAASSIPGGGHNNDDDDSEVTEKEQFDNQVAAFDLQMNMPDTNTPFDNSTGHGLALSEAMTANTIMWRKFDYDLAMPESAQGPQDLDAVDPLEVRAERGRASVCNARVQRVRARMRACVCTLVCARA